MNDQLIHDTMTCLDQALARIAVDIAGSRTAAEAIVASLQRGEVAIET